MLSTSGVLVSVCDDPGQCPICGGPWHVQKTVSHHGKTLAHGHFEIRETVHVCGDRCRRESGSIVTRRALSLAEHIIPRRVIGYDVMVFVGLQRFLHHRQREEIRTALFNEHGIYLSAGEISNLSKLFLIYMQELHNNRIEQLRALLTNDGGWPLHIDATCEDGRGTLLVALAGWRQWVLGAWKLPTERADAILPCLHEVVVQFGAPCAVMRDLGRGITLAVNNLLAELDLDIPVLACHYHFLKDIGTDLLKTAHAELRDLFRRSKIRPKLRALIRDLGHKIGSEIREARQEVKAWQNQLPSEHIIPQGRAGIATVRALSQWILDYRSDSPDQDFPFDRPYLDFYDRCMTAVRAINAFLFNRPEDQKVLKALKRLQRILQPVPSEVPFQQIVRRLRARTKLFDELRDALRLIPKPASPQKKRVSKNLSTHQVATELQDIRNELEELITFLKNRRPKRGPAQDTRKAIDLILRHIEDHSDYLWGHVISLPENMGGGIRILDRTNNILESFFKGMKHDERRRSGRKILTHDFENLPPSVALVYNLNCPDYVSIVCGSLEDLHKVFAKLDFEKSQRNTINKQRIERGPSLRKVQSETASLPADDRRLIRTDEMKRHIVSAAKCRAPKISPKLI
jgi:hypothetical protein